MFRKNVWSLVIALLVIVPAAQIASAADQKSGRGPCTQIQGQLDIVEGVPQVSEFTINGEVEQVMQIPVSDVPIPHGKMDRGSEYADVISFIDGSSFRFIEDFTSVHSQNIYSTDPNVFAEVNASGTIVGQTGRWANAIGHMTMHGTFNFAVFSMHLSFNGNICGI